MHDCGMCIEDEVRKLPTFPWYPGERPEHNYTLKTKQLRVHVPAYWFHICGL